jgi:hypothetical protein
MTDRTVSTTWCRRLAGTLAAMAVVFALVPCASPAEADIYRWEDERGVIHFTDNPAAIPDNLRGKIRPILKEPPASGKPGLSTVGSPSFPSSGGVEGAPAPSERPAANGSAGEGAPPPSGDTSARQAETLRAKIDAKEGFLGKVDTKRSNIMNPLGNRFISPEDLELYKKYSDELPGDRERLREIESRTPPIRE